LSPLHRPETKLRVSDKANSLSVTRGRVAPKQNVVLVSDFYYELPEDLIAQEPAERRDRARLLIVDRANEAFEDSVFDQLPGRLEPGDVLVLNNTQVFPARLIGRRLRRTPRGEMITGGRVEIFLVHQIESMVWEALVKPGRALLPGARVEFQRGKLNAEILEWREGGRRIVRFEADGDFDRIVNRIGRTPLPPYIKRDEEDRLDAERYQTVFAKERGAVAAPTAGLHFTTQLLDRVKERGVEIVEITLHVGYGTFQPVRVDKVEDHVVEPEVYSIDDAAAALLNAALDERRRIVAVGTTTTRALESAALENETGSRDEAQKRGRDSKTRRQGDTETAGKGSPRHRVSVSSNPSTTSLFIHPGFQFRVVGGLITNFHLPCSSLLMLVSAFGGHELMMKAYRHAVLGRYRFYSYGDAMLIL